VEKGKIQERNTGENNDSNFSSKQLFVINKLV